MSTWGWARYETLDKMISHRYHFKYKQPKGIMSVLEKLIQKIFNGSQISYNDAEKILLMLGYELRIRSSHHGFRKNGFPNIILKRRSQLLPYQIQELQEVLLDHGYEKKI